jgi:hypothetical protein
MTLTERIASLSVLTDSDGPVASVYLSTRWTDEQQRERTRAFLKTELGGRPRCPAPPRPRVDLFLAAAHRDRAI